MASRTIQSSSSFQNKYKYDVFVSFRGEDTRNNFTNHLFGGLQRKGIVSFRDDTKLKRGESISSELIQAIEASHVFIVVFSKNYANSTWCLEELAKMLDCIETSSSSSSGLHQHILPVFYDVDPSEVRYQNGNFRKAFEKHEERFKDNLEMMERVQKWKGALRKVANLSGWDVQNKPQYVEIEEILAKVTSILGLNIVSLPNDLVGMHSPLKQLEKLLNLDSEQDVRVVGICGMGGIGKTTLATVLYDRLYRQYDACCFIDNVSKTFRDYGSIGAQKQLLFQVLKEDNLQVSNYSTTANLIRTRLRHMKVLIVLDNVDQFEQLEKLSLNREWLGAGSRIIIISRDKHILSNYRVDGIYNVELLNNDNALRLFSRTAFKCDDIMINYTKLTYEVLAYAQGLPLAIKVLGSFLYGRDVSEWRSALVRLRENPSKDIMDVLRLSFDGLEEMDKEIFLDIACFFHYQAEQSVKEILESCGFQPNIGIRVLMEKSLINIVDGIIHMHDLLQDLGKKIVREKSPKEPSEWSRLWFEDDFLNIVNYERKAIKVEAIVLDDRFQQLVKRLTLKTEAFSKMSNLRLLILKLFEPKYLGKLKCLPSTLCYLELRYYPFKCLPSSFQPTKLVQLILQWSNIKHLWKDIKVMPNLKVMDLSYSENLIKTPDFRGITNLEKLVFDGCRKLRSIDPSVGLLGKLTSLNLRNCTSLVSIPDKIFYLNSLEILDLHGCSRLFKNQVIDKERNVEHLKILDSSESAMHFKSKSSIYKRLMNSVNFFYPTKHKDSAALLLPSLRCFLCLRDLDLSFCNLSQVPDAIGWLHGLENLKLGGNNFDRLPSIKQLSKLTSLDLSHCKQLKSCHELPTTTILPTVMRSPTELCIFNCPKLQEMECWNNVAFPWMLQVIQAQQESSTLIRFINIFIPGNQIPSWYNIQSVGDSINVDPSSVSYDSNWIGVSFCVPFPPCNLPYIVISNSEPDVIFNFKCICSGKVYLHRTYLKFKCGITAKDPVEKYHLWLFYMTREEFISVISSQGEETHNLYHINFEIIAYDSIFRNERKFKVKKCGMRWVYKQDLEPHVHDGDFRIGRPILSLEPANSSA